MTITAGRAWVGATGSGVTLTNSLAGNPATGDVACAFAWVLSSVITLSINQAYGDGVSYTAAPFNPLVGSAATGYFWWKVCGSCSNANAIITPSVSGTLAFLQCATYHTDSGTWTADGTWTTNSNAASTNPDPGAVTPTAGVNSLSLGNVLNTLADTPTAATNWTRQVINSSGVNVATEDRIIASTSGSYDASWTAASSAWAAINVMLSAITSGGGGGPGGLFLPHNMGVQGVGGPFFQNQLGKRRDAQPRIYVPRRRIFLPSAGVRI